MTTSIEEATNIASTIRALLKAQGRSVAWLSDATCIPYKTADRRLKDPSKFSIAELSAIASALDVQLESLFEGIASVDLERRTDAA